MEHEVQFDSKRETLPGLEMLTFYSDESRKIRKEVSTGAAWLIYIDPFQSNLKSKPAHNGETPMFLC